VEQELNRRARTGILEFLGLCRRKLRAPGRLLVFALNGANPITGVAALAQNFQQFNSFTAYTLRQVLLHSGYERVVALDLNLYVFYGNLFKYVAMAAADWLALMFRVCFLLYGKKNRMISKKIAATCVKPAKL
jgi:hypothetical protein